MTVSPGCMSEARELLDRIGAEIRDDQLVTAAHQAARHVGAHAAEADHSELHSFCSLNRNASF